ncbi:MAG: ABC transporter ATP-binding protein [Chloroflexi bacterium HGW-Chloroflexi-1]|nr:MAG: ABC transporter ATP-binding protein [Chloroflexi bacterium HGW-Chloroflexi-1]
MNTALLAFQDISFSYPSNGKPVFQRFALEIAPGAVTAILGPNGAGKTTLLHMALGWLKPQGGQITLQGRPLGSYSRGELGRWIGLVPQSEHTAFEYSLFEYVLLGRAPYLKPLEMPGAEDRRIALDALARVGLAGWEGRSIARVSGGERQLVLVARALAQQPRFLLLDEPTSHLDLGNKVRLLGLLRELASQGVTILFTTHEPEVSTALATHLVLMRAGQVLHTGTLTETFTGERLSAIYGVAVEVAQVNGRQVVLWG